jgi:3-isopropylmalate/(R)-2-methylmalate dehydratase small subunit
MKPFMTEDGVAAPLPAANIDTDVIMPKRFLKGIDRSGLAQGVFHNLRFDEQGSERGEFVLNQSPWREAKFLIVGPNFGCGSSREHAVWGLLQLGIRAIVGTSFGGIFFDNCARNGLLAVSVGEDDIRILMDRATDPTRNALSIDLERRKIAAEDGYSVTFDIETSRREALMDGLDTIGTTLRHKDEILAFERRHLEANPWLA